MPIRLKKLRKCLKQFDVWEETSRGKGSHTLFKRQIEDQVYSYPIPTHDKDVLDCYVKQLRKQFRLTPDDGVSDEQFFCSA
jgi:hypothetical protein